jgi:hypothetical protein
MTDFVPMPKIARWSKQIIVITEKIDGTNASIHINDDCTEIRAASRNRWITVGDDNFGFARWVQDHQSALLTLGKGAHFGEFWGLGIQRCYNEREKHFSLFNTLRWSSDEQLERLKSSPCRLVPVLYQGAYSDSAIEDCLQRLRTEGSVAAPGFQNPEGVVIYIPGAKMLFKKTLDNDDHKGIAA